MSTQEQEQSTGRGERTISLDAKLHKELKSAAVHAEEKLKSYHARVVRAGIDALKAQHGAPLVPAPEAPAAAPKRSRKRNATAAA